MEENQVAYMLMLSTICFIFIMLSYRFNRKFATINFILFLIYNAFFYYGLFNWQYGSSLYAIVGLSLFLPIHILILVIYLIINLIKTKK